MKKPLSALVVDDERPARQLLCELLAKHREVHVQGEADGVVSAARLAADLRPDVIFLDVQMPPWTAFDLLPLLPAVPALVFVTAHDAFAVRAFEVNALDYLLKPVHPRRLARTIERLTGAESASPESPPGPLRTDDLVMLKDGARMKMVPMSSLAAIQAEGAYTRVFASGEEPMLILRSIGEWESLLPSPPFLRADRSVILNKDLVRDVQVGSRNEMRVQFAGVAQQMLLGRSAAVRLRRALSSNSPADIPNSVPGAR